MEETHQWRKWTKYFMFQLEAIISKSEEQVAYAEALETLTNTQGKLHDLHVLQQIVQDEHLPQAENTRINDDLQKKQIELETKIKDLYPGCFPDKKLSI